MIIYENYINYNSSANSFLRNIYYSHNRVISQIAQIPNKENYF
jgi:hypothetical protein